jgi:hypothetical protein
LSDLESKLERPRPSLGGAARASRKQLLARWGSAEAGPERITIDSIGGRECWRRVSSGVDGLFELEPSPPPIPARG